jgi:hypothetical protein
MIKRILNSQIVQSLQHFPAVGLVGARQVGKTTLAQMIAQQWPEKTLYLDLERPADFAALTEPELFLSRHTDKLVIMDEIQLRGDLFPVLRSLIDNDRRPGRFLLLGSSSPDLMRQSGESLAGRIAYHELSSLLLNELSEGRMDLLWMRGGFPDSVLAASEEISGQWRENFILTYLQRDLALMGYNVRVPVMKLRQFWQMLAHTHGQLTNLSQLAMNMELSRQSVRKYLDILQETFMVRQLQPFHTNLKKRLVKSPKLFIRDSGVLHTLLGINSFQELVSHSILGRSWEGFCLEQILSQLPRGWSVFFYRTQAGAEVDLIVQRRVGEAPRFVEFKYSQSPKLTRGFWEAKTDLRPGACYVIYPGAQSYPLGESIEVLPVSQIAKIWQD